MKFAYFHLMPYTGKKDETTDWPVANKLFDPELGKQLYDTYLDSMVQAEAAGFDWIGCNEHHMSPYGMMANPNIVAASLIPRTSTAQLAVMGQLVPLLNPIRVAEEYAMLDVMSGGRVIAGLLRGIPHEYVAYNIPPDESHGRLSEAIDLIIKAWTEPEPFGWEGEYYQYRAVSIWPRPMQKPYPRIMMSCSNEVSARVAAKKGAMFGLANLQNFDHARMLMKVYREEAKDHGWEPTPDDFVIALTASVDEDIDLAKDRLTEGRRYFANVLGGGLRTAQQIVLQKTRYMDEDTRSKFQGANAQAKITVDDLINEGIVVCGTPEMAVEQIKRVHGELGMGNVNINMKVGNIPDTAITNQIKIFGEKILPQVKHL